MNLHAYGTNSLYSNNQTSRLNYLWPGPVNVASSGTTPHRNRCLSTSSVDSNTSSLGLSHLTPALAAMSVQHQQGSPVNSPYQSYSSSPQQQGSTPSHNYPQPTTTSSSETSYSYHISSPLSPNQVPAYSSLSMATTDISANIYGSTPPMHPAATDAMYNSSSSMQYSTSHASTPSYSTAAARYGSSNSVLSLAPPLFSEHESASTLSAAGSSGTRPFEYVDQYSSSQGQYYGQQQQQQSGLGSLVTGSMTRAIPSTPEDHEDEEDAQDDDMHPSGLKRNSISESSQAADDIQAVIGKDGKTLVYICPKCDPSKGK